MLDVLFRVPMIPVTANEMPKIALFIGVVLSLAKPMGAFMAKFLHFIPLHIAKEQSHA